jgi:hypothetical protein
MLGPSLDILDYMAAVKLVPPPIEVFGHRAKLDDEVSRQILGLDFATLLPPEAE